MGRLLQVAGQSRSDFESLVVIGVATMLMFQVVVNIFMTIGLGPVTGIPLAVPELWPKRNGCEFLSPRTVSFGVEALQTVPEPMSQ